MVLIEGTEEGFRTILVENTFVSRLMMPIFFAIRRLVRVNVRPCKDHKLCDRKRTNLGAVLQRWRPLCHGFGCYS